MHLGQNWTILKDPVATPMMSDKPKTIVTNKNPTDTVYRAVHHVRLSALSHNYTEVESAANRQRCSVIVVVKADGYGHGAIQTALHLADNMGADAFAVATLEEAIALRKAFQQTPPGSLYVPPEGSNNAVVKNKVSSLFDDPSDEMSSQGGNRRRSLRSPQIRILVLGAPVGFPRCFDKYYHYNIEVMITGPEVAKALLEWVYNEEERKRTQVEQSATELKESVLKSDPQRVLRTGRSSALDSRDSNVSADGSVGSNSQDSNSGDAAPRLLRPSVTLGNVTGMDLARELREILKNQKLVAESQQIELQLQQKMKSVNSGSATPATVSTMITPEGSDGEFSSSQNTAAVQVTTKIFPGIEEAAKISRTRQKAIANEVIWHGDDDEDGGDLPVSNSTKPRIPTNTNKKANPTVPRKRLRWHAIVDTGMGRLGFRTDPVSKEEIGKRMDSVAILKELVDLEVDLDCPSEFYGMCTHMAEATSDEFTKKQISKFKSLLKRVRAESISVPTISTDNSAALLTTTLTHFDSKELLTQEFADTRGFVRTGGAIYGQRPSFPQLRAVSTLVAFVRHVAVLKKGESVGYDRNYTAEVNMRIATLAIGFADGYPRELGNGVGKVAIRGHVFPVAGNVCMDMMMVELGPASDKLGVGAQVVVGDEAICWGPANDEEGEGLVRLQDVAAILKTTQSALTCGIDKERVLRIYS